MRAKLVVFFNLAKLAPLFKNNYSSIMLKNYRGFNKQVTPKGAKKEKLLSSFTP
jgi:hypothetical protein